MTYATNGQESGFFKSLSGLGNTLGVGVAMLATPALYNHTQVWLFRYFSGTFGPLAGKWMTWAMVGVYAVALYKVTALVFTGLVVWVTAAAAARRFSGE